MSVLLSAEQMQDVDRRAVEQGLDSFALMQAAGKAVYEHALTLMTDQSTALVLAGPGNNGGDGFVAAGLLKKAGCRVNLLMVGRPPATDSDAGRAMADWNGTLFTMDSTSELIARADIIIDALFGAGLTRPLAGDYARLVYAVNHSRLPVVAVDVPSGLNGNTNVIEGACIRAQSTVTFFRFKSAHFLYPGRKYCGKLVLSQIGLSDRQLDRQTDYARRNIPALFASSLPLPTDDAHKFERGHVLVRSGPVHATGAARLSAVTALYTGAGLVTLATTSDALPVNASHLTAVMLAPCDTRQQWRRLLEDVRINIAVVGPANGLNVHTQAAALDALASGKHCVLDADALSCWRTEQSAIVQALKNASQCAVLTPHAGEFKRLFNGTSVLDGPSKLHQAQLAAELTASVIVYKGSDTVIAAADGRTAINDNAPAWLATAGAGDVLAGAIAALIAQGMAPFEAACAGVWLHGQAARTLGYPLCAEQLVEQIGREIRNLLLG